jgi:hypothetical protein
MLDIDEVRQVSEELKTLKATCDLELSLKKTEVIISKQFAEAYHVKELALQFRTLMFSHKCKQLISLTQLSLIPSC